MDAGPSETSPDFLTNLSRKKEKHPLQHDKTLAPAPYADLYNMDHTKRGMAIIFNHVIYSNPSIPKRDGSDKDRDDLYRLFETLGFETVIHQDLTEEEVDIALHKTSKLDFSDSDCLVIVVMSHGDNGIIYAKDKHYQTKLLWKKFTAERCPSLAGKPKLFFIQACRGTGLHKAHYLHYGLDESDSHPESYYSIPNMADILVMYSTMEGDYSWRDPVKGSYFIQSLVEQMQQHYKTKDLLTILTFVNRQVAIDFTSYDSYESKYSGQKQMCTIVSMLTRQVYFSDIKSKHCND